ncbi:MAG: hypothetical protein N3F08_04055 [Crenarchaeota archaeon]|nr:hypothetical protein [Thermoproteota archaeon]
MASRFLRLENMAGGMYTDNLLSETSSTSRPVEKCFSKNYSSKSWGEEC